MGALKRSHQAEREAHWKTYQVYVLFRHHRWDTAKQVNVSVDGNAAHGVPLPTSQLHLIEGRWSDRIVMVGVPRWLMHKREIAWKRFEIPAERSYHNKDVRTLTPDEKIQLWDDERWTELKASADFQNGIRPNYNPTGYDRKFNWQNA